MICNVYIYYTIHIRYIQLLILDYIFDILYTNRYKLYQPSNYNFYNQLLHLIYSNILDDISQLLSI